MRSLTIAGLLLAAIVIAPAAEPPVPAPQGYVTDLAGIVPPAARARMISRIEALKARTGAEIAVVTVRSTAPYDDFTYAMRVFDAWKPGRRREDTGAVVLLAIDDRKLRVVTGYGLEGILPDGLVGEIQDREMIPSLRAGRPDEALERGVEAIAQRIETGGVGSPTPSDGGGATPTVGGAARPAALRPARAIRQPASAPCRLRRRHGAASTLALDRRAGRVRWRISRRMERGRRRLRRIRRRHVRRRWRRTQLVGDGMRKTLVAILMLTALSGCGYNQMVSMREGIESAWAQVENQLQRRNDLIPNLVEVTKGYAAHEKGVFDGIANARARMLSAGSRDDKIEASNQLTAALGRLIALREAYPDLKANQQFARLSDELAGTENRIAVERMRYNEQVKDYNAYIKRFPQLVYAAALGFSPVKYFDAPPEAQQVPKVDFGTQGAPAPTTP